MLSKLELPDIYGCVEILCFALVFYYVLLFFRGTRGATILTGFILLFFVVVAVTRFFRLDALSWLLGRFSVYLAVALLVIFQPEIRRVLAELGKQHFFRSIVNNETLVDYLVQAATFLSERKIGALIAIERDIGFRSILDSGIRIDSEITPELLIAIFFPYTPLHDGGVVVSENRITAARCMFPLSQHTQFPQNTGTRHRAAVGLTEETDAVVIVVSEETGIVSVSHEGRLIQNLDEGKLRRFLEGVLLKPEPPKGYWFKIRNIIKTVSRT